MRYAPIWRALLAGATGLALLSVAPAPPQAAPPEIAWPNGARLPTQWATLDGVRIAYTDTRAAAAKDPAWAGKVALVLVHGWSSARSFWAYQLSGRDAAKLVEDRRLIAIDLPGHGESDKPRTKYTMDGWARAIARVMDEAGVERAVLAGHSNGTPVVRQFYRLFPHRTAGLVVVDGPLRAPFDAPEEAEPFIAPLRGPDSQTVAAALFDSITQPMRKAQDRAHVRAVALATPQHAVVAGMEAATESALWVEDRIEVPLLALMAMSPNWSPEYEAFVRQLAPGCDYQVIGGVSHLLMMDRPEEFNAALLAWLTKHGM